jgi:hypothetical protein
MPKGDKTFLLLLIDIRIILLNAFILESYLAIQMVNIFKNVINNILFHNHIKGELDLEQEEICTPYFLRENPQTAVEEILHLEILDKLSKRIRLEQITKKVN